MDCCGHAHDAGHHHAMWGPVLASVGAMLTEADNGGLRDYQRAGIDFGRP